MFTTDPEELPHEDDEGYALVECEACRCFTLDDNTDVCRNPACPTNDIVREAIAMCETDEEIRRQIDEENDEFGPYYDGAGDYIDGETCHACQQRPCICEEG